MTATTLPGVEITRMSTPVAKSGSRPGVGDAGPERAARAAFGAAVLGFFVITLDASVVNVVLPAIRDDLGGGMSGLQWVIDGYTLMFAALLLSAGSLSDRVGARRAFGTGMVLFIAASVACGLAPNLPVLIAARLVQGVGAALMTPSSLALIREAYPDSARRARAIALWTIGGSVAAAAGPVAGGALNLLSWRAIFAINLPIGVAALVLLAGVTRSPRRPTPFDWTGQLAAVLAMGGLIYGVIEAGTEGFATPRVIGALTLAVLATAVFVIAQAYGRHPMVPLEVLRSRTVVISAWTGFAFLGGFIGMVFVFSLYLQQRRGLSAFETGLTFLPMTLLSAFVSMASARLAERFGPRVPIVGGMVGMGVGLAVLAALPVSTPVWLLAVVMIPVGITGPLAMPPTTARLLDSVPTDRSGVAGGVFNASRQIGGALAVAVFGVLLADHAHFLSGMRTSLTIAAVVAVTAAVANLLRTTHLGEAPA
jgi:DHA2 family methylenomycin A resistance protein-like MFS transporter